MELLVGQLIYTSFATEGFKTIASASVPAQIQKAFFERGSQYWDIKQPKSPGYRAVYVNQVTSQDTLFGWLYSDEEDVPYFICYYLREKLLDFELENIFTCLQQGPIALIDRHKLADSIETKVILDLWSYQSVHPGVVIPISIRKHSQNTLKQGKLLDLFVSIAEQETVLEFDKQNHDQHIALSIYNRYIIEGLTYTATTNTPVAFAHKASQQKLAPEALPQANTPPQKITNRQIKLRSKQKARNFLGLTKNNTLLLVGIGIACSAFLTSLIYGRHNSNIPANNSAVNTVVNSPTYAQTLAAVSNVPQGLFNYGGSTTFAPLRSMTMVAAISQAQRQFKLRFVEPIGSRQGSSTGIKMLLIGELSFAQSSRPVKPTELAQAQERGFTLEQIPVAIDGIAFFVNPQISVVGLNLSQLKDVFTGRITNWKALGGPNLLITPFSPNSQVSGTADIVKEQVLLGKNFGKNVKQVTTTTESILKVAKTPGGIGYSSAALVIGQKSVYPLPLSRGRGQIFVTPFVGVNQTVLNKTAFANASYPLTRRLFVIIKRDRQLDEQAGVAYANLLLSDEGQRLIDKAGFIPMR